MRPRDRNIVIGVCIVAVLAVIAIGLGVGLSGRTETTEEKSKSKPTPKPIFPPLPTGTPNADGPYSKAAVATDAGPCSDIGKEILEMNGTAVDAAVAVSFCIGVINMHSAGIGGGGFMLVYEKAKKAAEFINYREMAPGKSYRDMYKYKNTSSRVGGLATAIPGEVKGLYEAHKTYGKLTWSQVVNPAIKLARDGFQISIPVYEAMNSNKKDIEKDPGLKALLFNGENMKQLGEPIKNEKLAETLLEIARHPYSFYNGSLAEKVVEDVRKAKGILTLDDLKKYKVERKSAIVDNNLGDLTLYATDPPSSGAVVALIINILKEYNFTKKSRDEEAVLTYHRVIEAFKYGFAGRAELGDPNFDTRTGVDTYDSIKAILSNMTSPAFAESIHKKINDSRTWHDPQHYMVEFAQSLGPEGTSHLSILDENGNAVSLTTTINFRFGAKYRSLVTGIIYNNEMDDFSSPNSFNYFGLQPSKSNYIAPFKRPMSSMSPVIFADNNGNVRLIAGASGGTRIITATILTVMNKLWFGRNLTEAVVEPRFHNQLFNTSYEALKDPRYHLAQPIREGLEKIGHYLHPWGYAVVQAVSREDDGKIFAKADPRKHGWATGY